MVDAKLASKFYAKQNSSETGNALMCFTANMLENNPFQKIQALKPWKYMQVMAKLRSGLPWRVNTIGWNQFGSFWLILLVKYLVIRSAVR